jgi:hypothetical protein
MMEFNVNEIMMSLLDFILEYTALSSDTLITKLFSTMDLPSI